MGDYHAIAAVTATLVNMIHDGIQPHMPGVKISTERPKREESDSKAQVNVFLYHATPNPSLRNMDVPTRREDGTLIQTPRLALDLHYLLTFYGSQDLEHLQPQVLLGLTLDTLHVRPFLTTEEILEVLSVHHQFGEPGRIVREAAQRVEQIVLADVSMELEALSRLWSMAFQVPYALSIAYKASAAIISAELTPEPVLPVVGRNFEYFQFRPPELDAVAAAVDGEPDPVAPIFAGSRLVLEGRRFQADQLTVAVGATFFDPPPHQVTDTRIDLALDPHTARGRPLVSGHLAVRVIADVHSSSEPLVIALRPRITGTRVIIADTGDSQSTGAMDGRESHSQESGVQDADGRDTDGRDTDGRNAVTDLDGRFSGKVESRVVPQVAAGQEVEMLLNQLEAPTGRIPYSFSFRAVQQQSGDLAVVPFEGVPAGTYLLRLRIGGAESVPFPGLAGIFRTPLTEPNITIPPDPASDSPPRDSPERDDAESTP